MDQWNDFRDSLGQGTTYREFDTSAKVELNFVPDFLKDLWAADGWASYRNGLFWTVDPREFKPLIDLWNPPNVVLHPIARSAFGAIYSLKEFTNDDGDMAFSIGEIEPHSGSFSVVGSARGFLTRIMPEEDYLTSVFWESRVKRAIKDVGPLEWDEMYAFEPALALGGSGEPETVRRVKLFDHHLLLSQVVGDLKFVNY